MNLNPGSVDRDAAVTATLRRLCGLIGVCWGLMTIQIVGWVLINAEPIGISRDLLVRLLEVQGVSLLSTGLVTLILLPRERSFDTRGKPGIPSPWPLMLAGLPMLPFSLLAPRAGRRPALVPPSDAAPLGDALRHVTVAFAAISAVTAAASAAHVVIHGELDLHATVLVFGAAIASTTPWAAVVLTRGQAMLAPYRRAIGSASEDQQRPRRSLVRRFSGTTAAILVGMVCAPTFGSVGFVHQLELRRASRAQLELAERAASLATRGASAELGTFLATHEQVAVEMDGRPYGRLTLLAGELGPRDLSVAAGSGRVVVGHVESSSSYAPLVLTTILIAVSIGLLTALSVLQGLQRDLRRAAERIRSVTEGGSLSQAVNVRLGSAEIAHLVDTMGGLVTRITETNVARYVAIERAQEADRLKSQFLANMSHDLRSPLNSILGFSELLLSGIEGPLSEDHHDLVQTIHDNGRTLLQQIDDILDTAKIDAGHLELQPEPTPAATLVAQATSRAKARFQGDITVVTNLSAGLPAPYVDPIRTVQALENVLVFAAEPLNAGSLLIDVSQRTADEHLRYIVVSIRSPIPMPSTAQMSAAHRGFFRLPGHHGLGLTLPIAGSILELASGSLDVSQAKNMTVFTVELPVPRARRKLRLDTTSDSRVDMKIPASST